MMLLSLKNFFQGLLTKTLMLHTSLPWNQTPPLVKKDYDGPLYAPWHKVVAGRMKRK